MACPELMWTSRGFHLVISWIAIAVSGTLTVFFAIGGAFVGGIAGGLAGWASKHGVVRGTLLLAMGGASVATDFLDALHDHWGSYCSSSPQSSSMVDLFLNLLYSRFFDEQFEQFQPEAPRTYQNQQGNSFNEVLSSNGLSVDMLKKLPCYILLDETEAEHVSCCTICLQDIEVGDTARSLPQCHHIFHLACVDQWLIRHGSCPVCRQHV